MPAEENAAQRLDITLAFLAIAIGHVPMRSSISR